MEGERERYKRKRESEVLWVYREPGLVRCSTWCEATRRRIRIRGEGSTQPDKSLLVFIISHPTEQAAVPLLLFLHLWKLHFPPFPKVLPFASWYKRQKKYLCVRLCGNAQTVHSVFGSSLSTPQLSFQTSKICSYWTIWVKPYVWEHQLIPSMSPLASWEPQS